MTWTSEERQTLERENARIGLDRLVPTPADPELWTPDGYLGLLRTIPDGSGVDGLFEAFRQHAKKKHPLDENAV